MLIDENGQHLLGSITETFDLFPNKIKGETFDFLLLSSMSVLGISEENDFPLMLINALLLIHILIKVIEINIFYILFIK